MNCLRPLFILFYTSSLFHEVLAAEAQRPNIILIVADDLGYSDVAFNAKHFGYDAKTSDVIALNATPRMDSLVSRGTLFTQAYVAHPFCGPSRMALMSGRMPHTYGGQKNLPDVARNLCDQDGSPYNDRGIPVDEMLVSTVLKKSGYRTGCIGKWHMGSSTPFHPNTRGFDEFYGFVGGGHGYYPSESDKVEKKVNDYQYLLERNGTPELSPAGAHLTDTLTDETLKFIKESTTKGEPFFAYVAYNAPHSPLQAKTEDLAFLYPDHKPEKPENGVNYQDYTKRQNTVALVYGLDRGVGRIVDALEDPNGDGDKADSILNNTLLVFLSDNGGDMDDNHASTNNPLAGAKGATLEGGIRVPMFMLWPGTIQAGEVCNHPVLALDLYPTFARLARAAIPEGKKLDGVDMWDKFLANESPHAGESIFWLRHHGVGNEVAILKDNLKAYRKNNGKWKLIDLAKDIGETKDISTGNETLLRGLIDDGRKWSGTHIAPLWHDTIGSRDGWYKNGMPKYDATFSY